MLKQTLVIAALAAAPLAFAQSGSTQNQTSTSQGQTNSSTGASQSGVSGGVNGATRPNGTLSDTLGATSGAAGFSALDGNGDGMLSRDEIGGNARLSSRFGEFDSDKNGTLSNSEFSKFESSEGNSTSDKAKAKANEKSDKAKDKADNLNSPSDVKNKIK